MTSSAQNISEPPSTV